MLSYLYSSTNQFKHLRFNNKEVLEAAKANVEKYYSVVGVTELWDETLEVLEHQLPFFFKGNFQIDK